MAGTNIDLLAKHPLWERWVQLAPDKIALKSAADTLTWSQLSEQIQVLRQQLVEHHVSAGDVVCLVGRAEQSLVLRYLACVAHGAIPALLSDQPKPQLMAKFNTLYRPDDRVLVWGHCQWDGSTANCGERELYMVDYSQRDDQPTNEAPPSNIDLGESIASIVFTSGSTGQPKAVAHTASHHQASADGLLQRFSFTRADSWLLSLPMFHVSGLAIIWRWLNVGATLHIASGDFADDIANVTHASLVATQLKRIIDNQWPTTLKRVLLGGSHIAHSLVESAQARGIEAWMGYGMTETASTVTAKRVDSIPSSGVLLSHRALKVEHQRIYLAGNTLACGYFQQGQIVPLTLESGWFDTKDLGHWNSLQELCVVGRADNLFISGGENVHCEEVEAALNSLTFISQAMVVPVEDEEFGVRCVAVVQANTQPELAMMRKCLLPLLAKFKHPIAYYRMPSHLASTGIKVARRDVKQWLSDTQSDFIVIS
ncbi:o-succinylbenzoate--CoA ligase [Vibrio sp. 10N]|uniref:o-succinylbenzoate--CoA ligase n=1 Tax=Vibrio sp. 10N TaxID=3058938 RepID=UPI00281359D8|nr:o-succinylbenzoate--CoA ligase [Vibrio sp. 10N]